jgi:hypothetical protein
MFGRSKESKSETDWQTSPSLSARGISLLQDAAEYFGIPS